MDTEQIVGKLVVGKTDLPATVIMKLCLDLLQAKRSGANSKEVFDEALKIAQVACDYSLNSAEEQIGPTKSSADETDSLVSEQANNIACQIMKLVEEETSIRQIKASRYGVSKQDIILTSIVVYVIDAMRIIEEELIDFME